MAVTNTLQRIMNVAQTYIRNAPLTFPLLSAPNDFAFLSADWVRQFILSPPFAWRWNRVVNTITTVAGTQDYILVSPTFGWLEKATINDNAGTVVELQIKLDIAEDTVQGQPQFIAARLDDNAGNITFRLLPVPDKAYTVTLTSQKSAPIFANLTDTWAPIPDYFSYLYLQGFIAKTYEYFADERFPSAMQLFVKQLLAANEGLDESQKNIYLGPRIDSARNENSQLQKAQFGVQARVLG